MKIHDVIIIGKGPAGISASLYTTRANLDTLIIGKDQGALEKARNIDNYYGLDESISGEKLLMTGESQAKKLRAQILYDEVTSISELYEENYFKVSAVSGQYYSRSLLIATGQPRRKLHIKGLKEFEGKGVSYCTTCDGFFYRDLSVGVLGFNNYAIHEAMELETYTDHITIFTNGAELDLSEETANIATKYKINTQPINKLVGDGFFQKIQFSDGKVQDLDGIFVAYGSASSVDFATKLGIQTEKNAVKVDKDQNTSIEGVFAAGDCTGGFKQIATAVGQGALAGKGIIEYVRDLKKKVAA